MPIVLCRVDERLVHGQVVLGWGSQLSPELYVVVDTDLAGAEWEQELYRLSLPADSAVEFVSLDEAAQRFGEWDASPRKVLVLFRGLQPVVDLAKTGVLSEHEVNLGGLHYSPGREEMLPFLHLEREDVDRIAELGDAGVTVTAQELPGSPVWTGADLVRKGGRLWSA